jgi:aminopeptidase N
MSMTHKPNNFAPTGSRPHYNPDRVGKVTHIALDLKIDFDQEIVHGSSTTTLSPLRNSISTLEINAVDMEISGVWVNSEEVKFEYDGQKIFVYLQNPTQIDTKLTIRIGYKLEKPKMGLTFVKPTIDYPDKPVQFWTQGESEQSRYWYPCFDYPLQICTTEIKVELPNKYTTVSNGILVSQVETGENRIDHWVQDQPHPNYLMALTAGEFVEIKDSFGALPVNYYSQQKNEAMLRLSGQKTPEMIEFFSQKFGVPYPWKKYSQVWIHDYIWGGMENTSSTFNTERALVDQKALLEYDFAEILVAHELAHQWFGDYIVIEHWSHLWIKEGAATYSEYLWTEKSKGQDEFNYYKLLETREYLDEDTESYRRPIVTNVFRDTEDLYDRHSYSKGGLVYNMIRAELGDELFERTLQHFLTDNQHRNVDTNVFLDTIDEATGKNLRPLFDQYVFRGGHPEYKVGFSWDNENKLGKLSVCQKQATNDEDHTTLFDLNIPIDFGFINPDVKEASFVKTTLRINKKEQNFYFQFEQKPDFVSFDPQNNYLKTVELEMSMIELKNQLEYDPDPVNRIYAAIHLAKKSNLESLKALAKSLSEDKFWAVRAEVATQIGKINLDQSVEILTIGLIDPDPRVRKNAIAALSKFHTIKAFDLLYPIAKNGDTSYFVEKTAIEGVGVLAAKLKDEYIAKAINLFEEVLKNREGWNEVVRTGAIAGLSKLNFSPEALEILISQTKIGISQYLRFAALQVIGSATSQQTKQYRNRVIEILDEASKDSYISSERVVIVSLSQIDSPKVIPILNRIATKTLYGRIKNLAQETARKKQADQGAEKSINQIKEELELIRKDNRELKSKLEEIVARKQG